MQKELQKHVCSLELSRKLKELGFPQNSLFYWYEIEPNENFIAYHEDKTFEINVKNPIPWEEQPEYFKMSHVWKRYGKEDFTSAYLASELGEWMHSIKIDLWQYHNDGKFLLKTMTHDAPDMNEITECDCRARLLIWLAENNHLDAKSLWHNE